MNLMRLACCLLVVPSLVLAPAPAAVSLAVIIVSSAVASAAAPSRPAGVGRSIRRRHSRRGPGEESQKGEWDEQEEVVLLHLEVILHEVVLREVVLREVARQGSRRGHRF